VERGWSLKAPHRLIVTSATYRQSSRHRPDLRETDPRNLFLARQRRLRVEAEIVRDAALSASGLLSRRIGGPSVTPPQPAGVYSFTQRKTKWVAATGADRFRRGLYTKFIRSAPYPLLTTFDSPDFQSVCTARVRSNTPLQSLTLANDEAMFELAQGLAARLLETVPGTAESATRERIRLAFAICFSRAPTANEVNAVGSFLEGRIAEFVRHPDRARAVSPSRPLPAGKAAPAASWTAVARALLNTDEFLVRE